MQTNNTKKKIVFMLNTVIFVDVYYRLNQLQNELKRIVEIRNETEFIYSMCTHRLVEDL